MKRYAAILHLCDPSDCFVLQAQVEELEEEAKTLNEDLERQATDVEALREKVAVLAEVC